MKRLQFSGQEYQTLSQATAGSPLLHGTRLPKTHDQGQTFGAPVKSPPGVYTPILRTQVPQLPTQPPAGVHSGRQQVTAYTHGVPPTPERHPD